MSKDPNNYKTPASAVTDAIDWREYFHAVVDRLWLVILCLVVSGIYAAYKLSTVETVYRARSVLFIEQEQAKILEAQQVRDEAIRSIDMINTAVDLLRSYTFAQRVAAWLKLDQDPRFLSAAGIPARLASLDRVTGALTGMMSANYRPQTRLIDVFSTSSDPNISVKLANAYADEYIRYLNERRADASKSATQFLLEERDRLQEKMRVSEEKMQAFRERERAASVENMLAAAQGQLSDINASLAEIQQRIRQIDSDLAVVRANKDDLDQLLTLPSVASEPKVVQLS
jgi:uncharacterized protein involved in exopolysaccharide biosynthesis